MQNKSNLNKITLKNYKDAAFSLRKKDKIFEVYSIIIIVYYILLPYVLFVTILQPPINLLYTIAVVISFIFLPSRWIIKFKKQLKEEIIKKRK
ncbi:hypothetical protein KC960_05450 [Candidatus Saccharibacteria bacterium]|nr:hypothetical protein [Candidatus Saccharibacteria bacterium]